MVQTALNRVFRVDLYYLFQLELQTIMFTRLYIHIPYCRQKCPYCAFFSQEPASGDLGRYADLLKREMSLAAEKTDPRHTLDSIYFGGGTPSLLDPQQIDDLIQQAEKLFGLAAGAEITLEANPGTVDFRKLAGFRQAGITRLSLGTQSFDDRMLKALGRIHTARQALEAFAEARQAGFRNIGIDLIHGLPGQTSALWLAELRQAVLLAPEHLSIYGLTIEEGTPFAALYVSDSPLLPDEDLTAEMFESAGSFLESHGYEHYEIANYARAGFRSRHNSGYWKRDGYLGLGAGAHSLLRDSGYGTRFSNAADLVEYSTALHNGDLPRRDITPLVRTDAMAEYLFLGLRMADGVQISYFEQEFGNRLKDVFGQEIASSTEQGLLAEDTHTIRLTRRGMLLSNQVFQRFLP
jgi:oxygen-independent coproporphyrinogen-3 oxidase